MITSSGAQSVPANSTCGSSTARLFLPRRGAPVTDSRPFRAALRAIKGIGHGQQSVAPLARSLARTKISGSNLYTRLNYWIVACGGTAVSNPPALVGVENPGAATIACQGETFTFTVASVPSDVTNLKLIIEASEGQSNGVTRAHSKAVAIKMVATPSTSAVDIRADYVAKHGAPSAAAPKIFFRYYLVNTATGEKSGTMLAECKWTAGE